MKTSNAAIDPLETKAPETWRPPPPTTSTERWSAQRNAPPKPSNEIAGAAREPAALVGDHASPREPLPSRTERGPERSEMDRLTDLAARLSIEPSAAATRAAPSRIAEANGAPSVPDARTADAALLTRLRAVTPDARPRGAQRPPSRRLRETQRPGQRRAADPTRPPTLRAIDARRFASRTSVEPLPVSMRRALEPGASRPAPALSSEQTICGSCHAAARTLRASTLSSLGWRLGFFTGRAPGHTQRWFCPRCREHLTATLTQSPEAARKA